MPLNMRRDYTSGDSTQAGKDFSLEKASTFVSEVMESISPKLKKCEYYLGDKEKKLGNAPAVELANEELIIAPDILCTTNNDNVFWIEVKDKSQRFFRPDTGADLFQVFGWYRIRSELNTPVYVVFRDPSYELCLPKVKQEEYLYDSFRKRWNMFGGEPYGGFLDDLLLIKNNYPRIYLEKSRENPMYIFYFSILNMSKVISWSDIINRVDIEALNPSQIVFRAIYDKRIIEEDEIRSMINELFR